MARTVKGVSSADQPLDRSPSLEGERLVILLLHLALYSWSAVLDTSVEHDVGSCGEAVCSGHGVAEV